MSSAALACLMFVGVILSTVAAMLIARRLPEGHLSPESKEVVKLGLGVIGTLTALVLGLLVAATKGTYDAQAGTVKEVAAQIGLLDRILARYGPEAAPARALLRKLAEAVAEDLWPTHADPPIDFTGNTSRQEGEAFFESLATLHPATDSQRLLKSRAQEMTVGLGQLRQRLVVNSDRTIPTPLLALLCIWQAALFAGFGLLAARNATTIIVLIICMASVSGALFVVLELDRPFAGMIRVSDKPLRTVMAHLGD